MLMNAESAIEGNGTMFPFISVLIGVIGTIMLLIAGMAALGLEGADQVITVGEEQARSAVYVECCKDALVIHPERAHTRVESLDEEKNAWGRLLERLQQNRDSEYIVFLIRPDGIDAFEKAWIMAQIRGIDVGYDALPGSGGIRIRSTAARRRQSSLRPSRDSAR